jgi:hypothetical protein
LSSAEVDKVPTPYWFNEFVQSRWFNLLFWLVAVLGSGLISWNCFEIFSLDWWEKLLPEEKRKRSKLLWFQRWFNFSGSMFGWAILWLMFRRIWTVYVAGAPNPGPLTPMDLLGILLAFVGVTGWLPRASMGFLEGLDKIFNKAVDKVMGGDKES